MRGKVLPLLTKTSFPGITPAYAGKSTASPAANVCTGDHPRLCGEKCRGVNHEMETAGSPPPMRGKEYAV